MAQSARHSFKKETVRSLFCTLFILLVDKPGSSRAEAALRRLYSQVCHLGCIGFSFPAPCWQSIYNSDDWNATSFTFLFASLFMTGKTDFFWSWTRNVVYVFNKSKKFFYVWTLKQFLRDIKERKLTLHAQQTVFFVALFPLYPNNTGLNSQRHHNRSPHFWKKRIYRIFQGDRANKGQKRHCWGSLLCWFFSCISGSEGPLAKPNVSVK